MNGVLVNHDIIPILCRKNLGNRFARFRLLLSVVAEYELEAQNATGAEDEDVIPRENKCHKDIASGLRRYRMFDEILKEYFSMITRVCLSYANTKSELEDLRQDTLLNIWGGLEKFREESSLKTWIYRVTLNTCLTSLRKRNRELPFSETLSMVEIFDTDVERRQMLAEMYESISHLPDLDKAIVMMWLDEYSYDEISETIGMARNTVATRLRRAKEKLISRS